MIEITLENVKYTKIDIENALEYLSSNNLSNFKSENEGHEYSVLYKENRYAIKLIYEQMRYSKNLPYDNKIGATLIKDNFAEVIEVLPSLWNKTKKGDKERVIENLKSDFKNYLQENYPSKTDSTYFTDPFYLINPASTDVKQACKEKGIYFWKLFENNTNLEKYYNLFAQYRPKGTVTTYINNTNLLKEFFDVVHGGYINWIRNLNNSQEVEIFKTTETEGSSMTETEYKPELNQILYGPPGTGKTYNTVVKAMSIIDEWDYKNHYEGNNKYENKYGEIISYDDLKQRFNDLKNKGQIEFITFHQSYSYEEFVEGIKPYPEDGKVLYDIESGVFKHLCEKAETEDNFDEVYENFSSDLQDFNESDIQNYVENTDENKTIPSFIFRTSRGKEFAVTLNSNNNLSLYTGDKLSKSGSLTKINLKHRSDWKYYAQPLYDNLVNNYGLKVSPNKKNDKPYVLIIDEINRGNISKIFGELITLIEPDKRLGAEHAMTVTLPYSQQKSFGVPKNLYIIGTMNTSDRSIASVDIALRRRFKFEEMMPKSDLVADFDCSFREIFEQLNKRITILLDRDHQIGHSYFIKDKYKDAGIKELKDIWFDSILPLLNEYFYGDWSKLQAILGEAKDKDSFIKKIKYGDFPTFFKNACDDENTYEFVAKKDMDDNEFLTAFINAEYIGEKW